MNLIPNPFRKANWITSGVMLAVACLLAGCDTILLTTAPVEFYLKNECSFPIVVVITYDSGTQREVHLNAGQKEKEKSIVADPADSLQVEKDGQVLYRYPLVPGNGILIYNLKPTEVTFEESGS